MTLFLVLQNPTPCQQFYYKVNHLLLERINKTGKQGCTQENEKNSDKTHSKNMFSRKIILDTTF